MLLILKLVGQHVAGIQRIHPLHVRIFHRLPDHSCAHLAQALLRGFLHRNLADADNAYVSQGFLLEGQDSPMAWLDLPLKPRALVPTRLNHAVFPKRIDRRLIVAKQFLQHLIGMLA